MGLNTFHPQYMLMQKDWEIMRDTYGGISLVKAQGQKYLAPTGGMLADGMQNKSDYGYRMYQGYLQRALFFGFVSEAVRRMVGILNRKPPAIEVPSGMEDVVEAASSKDEHARQLLRRIHEAQLVYGRCGLLVDLPSEPSVDARPWISLYPALNIINWIEDELVILDESGQVLNREELTWGLQKQHRVLRRNPQTGTYEQCVRIGDDMRPPAEGDYIQPAIRGKVLERLPFVVINSTDTLYEPSAPPLLPLGHLDLAVYRSDADYRQHLHAMGQDTLVVIGARPAADGTTNTWRTGAGASIELDTGGDAKFIGVESAGLEEQRLALENDKLRASNAAGSLIDARSSAPESGESKRTRMVAQTTTLVEIAQAAAAGLQEALRIIAEWRGLDPDKVEVEPNVDFGDEQLTGQDMLQMMTARSLGFPISKKSLHGLAQDRGLTALDYEEELEQIAQEEQDGRDRGMPGYPGEDDEEPPGKDRPK